ncbi:hypothetical protein V5735_01560 (plasmid) [Haladaptatus sp. SPP-AMP-3]|uniref:hypothetical protein n=1 Tax=Haladaptatus sp. SPP-AMP-3 TaxID=3121295 RepID=UPI003C2CA4F8
MVFDVLKQELALDASKFTRGLKKAGASVTSFGSLAGGEFDEVGDEAEGAAAKTSLFSHSLSGIADEAKDAIIPTTLLQNRLDEVGDEAQSAGLKAAFASTSFASMSMGTDGLSARVGILSTSLMSLVPTLGVVGAALIPIGAALATVAGGALAVGAAFGAILGSGIVAWGKGFQKALKRVGKQIKGLVADFGQQFVPLLKAAVSALPGLVKNIIKAIGPVDQFKSGLRKLGKAAFKFLPKLVGFIFDLARWALPAFVDTSKYILKNFVPALRTVTNFGKDVLKVFGRLWPTVMRLGQTLKKALVPVLDIIVTGIQRLVRWFTQLSPKVQLIFGAFTALAPVLSSLAPTILSISGAVAGLISTVGSALVPISALSLALGGVGTALLALLGPLGIVGAAAAAFGLDFTKGIKEARTALVGKGGNGGIINKAINQLTTYLKTQATKDIKKAASAAFGTLVAVVKNAKIAVIGKSGNSGILNNLIGSAASYLKSTAFKKLSKAAGKALGEGIRAVALDVYNAIIGKQPSIIGRMISDIASYLKNDAYGDLKEATKILVGGITSVFEGLYDGLIGNSLIPDMFDDIANYIKNDAASDMAKAAKKAAKAAADALINKFNKILPDSFSIPSVTFGGGKVGGISIPKKTIGGQSIDIPQLADGGIVNSPTLAMIGEAGPEAVVPLNRHSSGGDGRRRPAGDINVYLDKEETRNLIREGAAEQIQKRERELKWSRRRAESGTH